MKRLLQHVRLTAVSTAAFLLPILAGCHLPGMNAKGIAAAWDNMRCDRRVAVFVNLRLDTEVEKRGVENRGVVEGWGREQKFASTGSATDYNRALAYFHSRKAEEVVFEGRTTAHGSIGEFRALNAGFSSIPDPEYKSGRVKITWNVKRTYHFAPEDAQGKYHPRTFWPRIFGTDWSDAYVSPVDAAPSSRPQQNEPTTVHLHLSPSPKPSPPTLYLLSYYGSRCHVQQVAYVAHEEEKNGKTQTIHTWDVVKEWEE